MTNKKFWLGILVMVLAFAMTVVGCDDGSKDEEDDDDYYDNRPSLFFSNVDFDNGYPVIGETITASYRNFFKDAVGTPLWTWYKTEEDTTYFSNVINKTSIGYSSTYTVKQSDVGFWIWAEVSYSGSRGTSTGRTSSTVIGIPATATVSVSMSAVYYPSRSYGNHSVTVALTLSDGRWNDRDKWNDDTDIDRWLTMSGTPSVSSWYSLSVQGHELKLYYSTSSNTTLPINLTATLNTAQLSTMRKCTNVYNTLSAGTPTKVSVSQWTISQY